MLVEQAEQAAAEVLAVVSVPAAQRATQAPQATPAQTVTTRMAPAALAARQVLAAEQPVSTSVDCPTSHSQTTALSKAAQHDPYGHLQKLRVVQAVDTAVQEVQLSDATQDKTKGCEMPFEEMVNP